jgi:glycine cleavage system aminomethyltransferase T
MLSFYAGKKVGETTSGGPSPCLPKGTNISMGYVKTEVRLYSTLEFYKVLLGAWHVSF